VGASVLQCEGAFKRLTAWAPSARRLPQWSNTGHADWTCWRKACRRAPSAELGRYDDETIAAVDRFRADKGLSHMGNPAGLVDARLIEALRTAYFAKRKSGL
jgi:hypothetical protein